MAKIKILIFTSLILSFSCKKEEPQSFDVAYVVVANGADPNNITVRYTTSDGSISGGKVRAYFETNWRVGYDSLWYNFRAAEGFELVFTGTNADVNRKAAVRLYINGKLKKSASSNSGVTAEIKYRL